MSQQPHPSQLNMPDQAGSDDLQQQINQAVNQLTQHADQEPQSPDDQTSQTSSSADSSPPDTQQKYFNRRKPAPTTAAQPEHLSAQQLQNIREEVSTPIIKDNSKTSTDDIFANLTPAKIALIAVGLFMVGIAAGLIVVFLV